MLPYHVVGDPESLVVDPQNVTVHAANVTRFKDLNMPLNIYVVDKFGHLVCPLASAPANAKAGTIREGDRDDKGR